MSDTTIIFIIAVAAFLILALVVAFRFKSVKNTFEGPGGFKISVEGNREGKEGKTGQGDQTADSQDVNASDRPSTHKMGASAGIKIGGGVSHSKLTADGNTEGRVSVGKDVINSDVSALGGQSADVNVKGDAIDSDIDVKNKGQQ